MNKTILIVNFTISGRYDREVMVEIEAQIKEAVIAGNIEKVQYLIQQPNYKNMHISKDRILYLLEEAILHGQAETLEYLLKLDSELPEEKGTATSRYVNLCKYAIENNQSQCVKIILKNTNAIAEEKRCCFQYTLIMYAITSKLEDIVDVLIEYDANVNKAVGAFMPITLAVYVSSLSTLDKIINATNPQILNQFVWEQQCDLLSIACESEMPFTRARALLNSNIFSSTFDLPNIDWFYHIQRSYVWYLEKNGLQKTNTACVVALLFFKIYLSNKNEGLSILDMYYARGLTLNRPNAESSPLFYLIYYSEKVSRFDLDPILNILIQNYDLNVEFNGTCGNTFIKTLVPLFADKKFYQNLMLVLSYCINVDIEDILHLMANITFVDTFEIVMNLCLQENPSCNIKQLLIIRFYHLNKNYVKFIDNLPRVQSLSQLCRKSFRQGIRQTYGNCSTKTYLSVLQNLPVPRQIVDYLRYNNYNSFVSLSDEYDSLQ